MVVGRDTYYFLIFILRQQKRKKEEIKEGTKEGEMWVRLIINSEPSFNGHNNAIVRTPL